MRVVFQLPDVGEGIHEAEIYGYFVEKGARVELDQTIIQIETDKAVVDLPAPAAGVVVEIPYKLGDTVRVGDVLIVIETENVPSVPEAKASMREQLVESPALVEAPATAPATSRNPIGGNENRVKATPHTRHLARQLGVEIEGLVGTGPHGRISDEDVRRSEKSPPIALGEKPIAKGDKRPDPGGIDEIVPLRGLRKKIAFTMARSFSTIPHVSHADHADVSELFLALNHLKVTAERDGVKLTPLAFFLKAVAVVLSRIPRMNSTIDLIGETITLKKSYHIGIATDTPEGLIVPIVHDADRKSILEIAGEIQDLAERARTRKLDPFELRDGTFTITNIGSIGGDFASPIILPPQAAILGLMRARDNPVVREGQIVMRKILPLVVSFDHRIIDGAEAARFMNSLIAIVENPLELFIELH